MILLTGGSGFLGESILSYIRLLGNDIKTVGRQPSDNFRYDFSWTEPFAIESTFQLAIHCAGKAHSIPKTEEEKQAFFDVNVRGTEHLLDALNVAPTLPKSFVFISTIAVYGKQAGHLIGEEAPLLAKDPYGLSKIQAEKIIEEWCNKNGVICTILRLPLIAGPNPPGNLKAMINGISKGLYLNIAGGKAKKSIVLAEDVAQIILKAAKIGGIYNLTDGVHPSFSALSKSISSQLGKRKPINIPFWTANLMAKAGDLLGNKAPINTDKLRKITSELTFDDAKARRVLGWRPRSVLEHFKIR